MTRATVQDRKRLVGIDTTFVLFFLAMEFARSLQGVTVDAFLMGTSTLMALVLPYLLLPNGTRVDFTQWLAGRSAIALLGLILGIAMRQAPGVLIPEQAKFLPMTFVILAAMVSCYVQFYQLIRLRPVK